MLIKLLIALLLITFPLGQLLRWELLGGQVVLRPNDIVAMILGLIGLCLGLNPVIQEFVRKKRLAGLNPVIKSMFILFGAMLLSLLFNLFNYSLVQILVSASYFFRFALYSGLYFIFKKYSVDKKYLILIFFPIVLAGFYQYIFVPDVSYLSAYNWDDHYYRLVSTFLDPGFTAAILCIGIIIVYVRHSSLSRILLLALFYLAFALTYSRAGFLMFIASFGVIAYYKKSWSILIGATLLIILTVLLLPNVGGEGTKLVRDSTTWARLNNWRESLTVFSNHPIFGVGYNAYRYATNAKLGSHAGAGADSSIFFVMATTGLVGLFAYLNLLKSIWQVSKADVVKISIFIGLLVNSFFNNTLFYPFVLELVWIVVNL